MSSLLMSYLTGRADGATSLEVARDVLAITGPPTLATLIADRALRAAGAAEQGSDGRWRVRGAGAADGGPTEAVAVVARTTGPRADYDQLFEIGFARTSERAVHGGAVKPREPLSDAVMERYGLVAVTLARGASRQVLHEELTGLIVGGCQLVVWRHDSGSAWLRGWLGYEPLELRPLARAAGLPATSLADVAGELGVPVPSESSARAWAGALARVAQALLDREVALEATAPPPAFDFTGLAFGREELDALPERPGVYRFLDASGRVLYVGKARSLRGRVASYFEHRDERRKRYQELVDSLHTFEVEETGSELEALLTELRQIRELAPPLNVQLEVRERRGVAGTFAIVLPGVADDAVDVLFIRDGVPRGRATVDRRARGMRELRRVMKAAIFAVDPAPGDPAEAQLVASWMLTARRTHPVIDLSAVPGMGEAARLVRACVTDPELFREAVIHV